VTRRSRFLRGVLIDDERLRVDRSRSSFLGIADATRGEHSG
jgi:hypothetical protein